MRRTKLRFRRRYVAAGFTSLLVDFDRIGDFEIAYASSQARTQGVLGSSGVWKLSCAVRIEGQWTETGTINNYSTLFAVVVDNHFLEEGSSPLVTEEIQLACGQRLAHVWLTKPLRKKFQIIPTWEYWFLVNDVSSFQFCVRFSMHRSS